MSFLTPLYILGALAVAAPIVFHLIRRSPRGEVAFSSLMFLAPTPPRLTRRSRLEHWFLLLLRATALVLLALAFARPFLRQSARADFGEGEKRRIAVLVDTSASLRRGDLWPRAQAQAADAIAACRPGDELALFAFDTTTRTLLSFEESATLDPARRRAVAQGLLSRLAPTWNATQLGQALIDAVAAIQDVTDRSEKTARMPRRVVVVSDLQRGSRLEALRDFEWPSDVELELRPVTDTRSNATLQGLAEAANAEPPADEALRVRVASEPGSRVERFALTWLNAQGKPEGKLVDVYVPPGESRVVRVARPPGPPAPRSLQLKGDGCEFDNSWFVAAQRREDATVLYIGKDAADDPAGLLYYLVRVFQDTPGRTVRVQPSPPGKSLNRDPARPVPLIVVAGETTADNAAWLVRYLRGGGTVLTVVSAPGSAPTLGVLLDRAGAQAEEARVNRDVMLGEIAFDHPLFAAFAPAQFNDFTKIHFWKYRRLEEPMLVGARVLARFENGDPALAEKVVGEGRLVLLLSGWSPADSQLARSSKFVPLMMALLEGRNPRPFAAANLLVHDRVPVPSAAKELVVHRPDGTSRKLEPGTVAFSETDQPGIYTADTPDGPRSFAVNLDPAEGRTTPLQIETLEQLGCRLVKNAPEATDRALRRQLHNAELEGRQKLWRWLILAVVGVLLLETWLAGRHVAAHSARTAEAPSS